MHGDIDFPTCLDHLFNVQTNKSRFVSLLKSSTC